MITGELKQYEDRYTNGDCWVLALALSERLGWDIAVVDHECHAFVVSADGTEALDIYGFQPTRQLLKRWNAKAYRRLESALTARRLFHGDPELHWGIWGGSTRVQWKLADRVANLLLQLDGSLYPQPAKV